VAECLAGLVYVNAVKPGAPAIFGTWCFVSDLRTGAMSGGSPEQALLSAAAGQMAHYYDLTGGTASGMTDSKTADGQAGAEKGINHALVGNAGANLIYEAAGMHASLLGFSLDSLVIDNDIIGMSLRTIKGIEVTEERLSFDVIKDVCLNGPGHYLGSDQTLQLMQTEYLYPNVGDRNPPTLWAEQGSKDVIQRAHAKVEDILASHFPSHIPEAVDAAIRAEFPVKLPRENMRAKA
jgi:trimethylamine---corrinoid protein Co-methyltransferase